jgi:CopG family nickel-responsive transcriptional regulator
VKIFPYFCATFYLNYNTMSIARFGVSLENELLEALDTYVLSNQFPNRSQAIRHLIEKNIVESKWKCNNIVAGGIMLTYDFNKTDIQQKIAEKLKGKTDLVLSVQQFYISECKVLEIIAVKGTSYRLTELSESLIGIKGIEHGKLTMSKVE